LRKFLHRQRAEIDIPVGMKKWQCAEVASLYQSLSDSGLGGKDFSVIAKFLRGSSEVRSSQA